MALSKASKQMYLRLPASLIDKLESCGEQFRAYGLDMTRSDVVRLLPNHALEATKCNLKSLLTPSVNTRSRRTR